MDKNEYISDCEGVLNDKISYEELLVDRNPIYREELDKITEENHFINKADSGILWSERRIPAFYVFPKIHKKISSNAPNLHRI